LGLLATVGLGCSFFLFTQTASADVSGTLLTGSTGTVTATVSSVTFNNDPSAIGGIQFACPSGGGSACDSDVATGSSLIFNGCATGVNGSAGCLFNGEGIIVNSPITAGSIGQPNFLNFSNNPGLEFSLQGITTGTAAQTNCAAVTVNGASCVAFAGAALFLQLKPGNETEVTLSLTGQVTDNGIFTALSPTYNGGFSELLSQNLPNGMAPTPVNIQNYFCPGGVCNPSLSITSSQSGSFTATAGTPEPSTIALTLAGGGFLMFLRRRQSRRGDFSSSREST
jgi:hypothetical protein